MEGPGEMKVTRRGLLMTGAASATLAATSNPVVAQTTEQPALQGQMLPTTMLFRSRSTVSLENCRSTREPIAVDKRFGFFVNHDLASYEVPVHADSPHQDVIFLDYPDAMSSPMKAKGIA